MFSFSPPVSRRAADGRREASVQRNHLEVYLDTSASGAGADAESTPDRFVRTVFQPTERGGFFHEAQSACALNHSNICSIHDSGQHHSQTNLAMELLEGRRLREVIARGPLPLEIVTLSRASSRPCSRSTRNTSVSSTCYPSESTGFSGIDNARAYHRPGYLFFGLASFRQQSQANHPVTAPEKKHVTVRAKIQ